jgi:hypothetical protein
MRGSPWLQPWGDVTLLLSSQHNYRDLTGRPRLMIGKKWVQFNYPGPQPLPFRTLCDDGWR